MVEPLSEPAEPETLRLFTPIEIVEIVGAEGTV